MFTIIDESIDLYKSGLPILKVCEKTGVSKGVLQRKLKKLGLTRSNKENLRKYHLCHDYFSIIDTEKKAYWLGFLYADGYVNMQQKSKYVGLALGLRDKQHLEIFRTHIEATYPIHEYTNHGFGVDVQYVRLLMTSEKMYDDLISKGLLPNKSLILTFPNRDILQQPLVNHFIRGYFDGDGSFSKSHDGYTVKICGTQEFLNVLSDHIGFPSRNLTKRKKDTKNNWCLEIGGRLQVLQIGKYMYDNATVYLDRKYQRYIELLD